MAPAPQSSADVAHSDGHFEVEKTKTHPLICNLDWLAINIHCDTAKEDEEKTTDQLIRETGGGEGGRRISIASPSNC